MITEKQKKIIADIIKKSGLSNVSQSKYDIDMKYTDYACDIKNMPKAFNEVKEILDAEKIPYTLSYDYIANYEEVEDYDDEVYFTRNIYTHYWVITLKASY